MRTRNFCILIFLFFGAVIFSCSPRSKYERRLKNELESGVRHDTLFLGLRFGMTQLDFYTHCWKLNRQGLIKQGADNTSVEYKLEDQLDHPATMNFYPKFYQEKIYEMPVQLIYDGWAPWNDELSAEKLQRDVLEWFNDVYGKNYIEVEHPKHGTAYVKIDGNRRISIFKEDDSHVWALFKDMSIEEDKNAPDTGNNGFDIREDITKKLEEEKKNEAE